LKAVQLVIWGGYGTYLDTIKIDEKCNFRKLINLKIVLWIYLKNG